MLRQTASTVSYSPILFPIVYKKIWVVMDGNWKGIKSNEKNIEMTSLIHSNEFL